MRTTEPAPLNSDDRSGVEDAFRHQVDAMQRGDVHTLDQMLAAGFVLTHMTGYPQPKAEWLTQMSAGQFVYHRIDIVDITTNVTGGEARLIARLEADATVYGGRHVWPLQLDQHYRSTEDGWVATSSLASTW